MFSIPRLYEVGSTAAACSDSSYNEIIVNHGHGGDTLISMAEAKAIAASTSHKEAERRRRKRINTLIATLKSILPNTIKTDKASLLGEAVRRVKELKKTTAEVDKVMIPSEMDELKVSECDKSGLMKATLSCEDRPEIILDMIEALKSAQAKVVRAEMSTVGGRTKSVVWVKLENNVVESDVGRLRRALKTVMDKSTFLAGSAQILPGNKRPRYYHLS